MLLSSVDRGFQRFDLKLQTFLLGGEPGVFGPVVDRMPPRAGQGVDLFQAFPPLFAPVVQHGETAFERFLRLRDFVLDRPDAGEDRVALFRQFRGVVFRDADPGRQQAQDHGDRGDREDVPQNPGDDFSDECHVVSGLR